MEIGGRTINNSPCAVYLGITLDQKMSFTRHAQAQAKKANKMIQNISRILPNISAAKQRKRLPLSNATHSLLLYGAPVWANRMSRQGWTILSKVQRRAALRVASAYRTVSNDALLIVAGIPPVELQAKHRKFLYDNKAVTRKGATRETAHRDLLARWQEKWSTSKKGRWTHTLIEDVKKWTSRRHGQVDFHITQALTGHGCFPTYLYKYGKLNSQECWFCEHHTDDAQHTLFECNAWHEGRSRVECYIGGPLTPEVMVPKMLESKENWEAIAGFVHDVMRAKEVEERRRQKNQ